MKLDVKDAVANSRGSHRNSVFAEQEASAPGAGKGKETHLLN